MQTNSAQDTSLSHDNKSDWKPVQSVIIAPGAHKYVLISARPKHEEDNTYFVTSKHGAAYHRNAAEALISRLETGGYTNIQVLGGGRIFYDETKKRISIFGYSYGFGRADHFISQKIIEADERFQDYDITWSNDGY